MQGDVDRQWREAPSTLGEDPPAPAVARKSQWWVPWLLLGLFSFSVGLCLGIVYEGMTVPPPRPWLTDLIAASDQMQIGRLTNVMIIGTERAVSIEVKR